MTKNMKISIICIIALIFLMIAFVNLYANDLLFHATKVSGVDCFKRDVGTYCLADSYAMLSDDTGKNPISISRKGWGGGEAIFLHAGESDGDEVILKLRASENHAELPTQSDCIVFHENDKSGRYVFISTEKKFVAVSNIMPDRKLSTLDLADVCDGIQSESVK